MLFTNPFRLFFLPVTHLNPRNGISSNEQARVCSDGSNDISPATANWLSHYLHMYVMHMVSIVSIHMPQA